MSIADKLLQVNQVKQDIKNAIETKGIPMTDVAFTEYANKILEISGGGSMTYEDYARTLYLAWGKLNQFATAWEHSLTVVTVNKANYPNGEIEGVIIPQGFNIIGSYAFDGWTSNNQPLVIPNSVTSIGSYAFRNWTSNNHPLVIPNSVTSIGSAAFSDWTSNNQPLIIPDSVTSIGGVAFGYWTSNNHPLVIPNSVTSIGSYAFDGWTSNDQPLIIPNSVTSIGSYAFSYWKSNNHPLVIPNSVASIGARAFYDWKSNNQPLVIPNSVASIGIEAFKFWVLVPYIEMKGTTPPTLVGKSAFDNQNNAPIYVPDESVDDYKTATNWSALASRIFPISEK